MRRFSIELCLSAIAVLLAGAADANEELIRMSQNPKDWVMPTRNYANHRYSALNQVTNQNVAKLQVAWTFSTGVLRGHEGSPLVIDTRVDSSATAMMKDLVIGDIDVGVLWGPLAGYYSGKCSLNGGAIDKRDERHASTTGLELVFVPPTRNWNARWMSSSMNTDPGSKESCQILEFRFSTEGFSDQAVPAPVDLGSKLFRLSYFAPFLRFAEIHPASLGLAPP